MIQIRHSDPDHCGRGGGLDIEGSYEELQAIHAGILAVSSGESAACTFRGDVIGGPQPYARWISQFTVSAGTGPTRVAVSGTEVRVDGDQECLRAFASFFDVPRDAQPGWHAHYEHYPGNRWVAADSEPTVVSLRRPRR